MKPFLIAIFILNITACKAQNNTLTFSENTITPKANLNQVSWLAGHWQGEAFGGITEEIWSPPLGDSMMFSFKLVKNNHVVFYELGGIRQDGDTLIFQLKHFSNDFKGWEEKNETITAKLIKIEEEKVFFDGFTFEKSSENEINIYVVINDKEKTKEVTFNYKRVQK